MDTEFEDEDYNDEDDYDTPTEAPDCPQKDETCSIIKSYGEWWCITHSCNA